MKKAGRETANIESDVCHFHHLALKKAPQPTPSFPHVIRNVIQPFSMDLILPFINPCELGRD